MTLIAIEGPAGCGKTTRLMRVLTDTIAAAPLNEGQRVLALTFMHGARRRLHEKLEGTPGIRGRFECSTVDSLAWRLTRRWRSLVSSLGIGPLDDQQFDAQCDAAGVLLERAEVRSWILASFPTVIVDEAQDLKPQRLRMIQALSQSANVIVAADEFQCLDPALRPNPLVQWIHVACVPENLNQIRRTNVAALLNAASAIRSGGNLVDGQGFRILAAQGVPMSAAYLANAIAWRQGGQVAIITPSLQGGFAHNVVQRVCQQACGGHGNGPYDIQWERSEDEQITEIIVALNLGMVSTAAQTLAALRDLPSSGIAREATAWVRRQVGAFGRNEFARADIEALVRRQVAVRRQRQGVQNRSFVSMTIQQAKNREFEGVVVLWPYQVGGNAEHKKRLLYNAVTRAKRWCTVIVQNPEILQHPPFNA